MSIDELSRALWCKVAPAPRVAFFTSLAAGLLVHLYAFTNLIPNFDGLSRVFDLQQMTISGRWFLHYASALNQFTQMPMVIGLLSVLFLAVAAALVTSALSVNSKTIASLTGGVMAAFPSLGYTFLYMFTASAYCLAILLAVLSVWLAKRGRWGWLVAVATLAMAMGTYQAYVTVAIGLSLLVVLRQVFDPAATLPGTFQLGLRLVAYLAAGSVAYYGVLLIFLKMKNLELLSYLGMDAASAGYPFAQLPGLVMEAYKQVVSFFFLPGGANGFANGFMVGLDLLALALGGFFFFRALGSARLKKELWRVLGGLAMVALLPLGINFGQIISPYSAPTPLMKYSFVLVYVAVLLLADLNDSPAPRLNRLLPLWGAALLVFCLNTNNLLYTASAQAHRATESYLTRMLSRVESCPGYQPGMELAVVGAIPTQALQAHIESYAQVDHYSVPIHTVAPLNKHVYYYLNDWLNVPVDEPDESVMLAISDDPTFAAMPLYPADGSVAILDGRVVVKLQSAYTPKSDFEIAYENRR